MDSMGLCCRISRRLLGLRVWEAQQPSNHVEEAESGQDAELSLGNQRYLHCLHNSNRLRTDAS